MMLINVCKRFLNVLKLFGPANGMERFLFPLGKVANVSECIENVLNAFQRFEMRCTEKRLNANFVKPVFLKDGHICKITYTFTSHGGRML